MSAFHPRTEGYSSNWNARINVTPVIKTISAVQLQITASPSSSSPWNRFPFGQNWCRNYCRRGSAETQHSQGRVVPGWWLIPEYPPSATRVCCDTTVRRGRTGSWTWWTGQAEPHHVGGAKGSREVPRAGSEWAGLGKSVRLRRGWLLDPAQATSRVRAHGDGSAFSLSWAGRVEMGSRGREGFGAALSMGHAGVGTNGQGGGLSGSLPLASGGGFRLSSASSCVVAGLACAGLPSVPPLVLLQRPVLLLQLAASGQSEQSQGFPENFVFKGRFLMLFTCHPRCDREHLCWANLSRKL